MTLLSAGPRPQVGQVAEPDTATGNQPGAALIAAVTAVRAVAAALCGLILTSGIALLVWAVSPQNGVGPRAFLSAGALAFAAGSGLPIGIGRAVLTLPPLLLGVLGMALLTAAVGRGRYTARTLLGETSTAIAAGVSYGAVVTVLPALLAPSGAVHAGRWWVPVLMATTVAGTCAILRGVCWRARIADRLPAWSLGALRLGMVAVCALVATGAVAVAGGLATSFPAVARLSGATAPGVADGAGMLLLQLCYLPNAVIAGTGYASGIGFTIGSGSYTPFGSSMTDLPAIPLLAAGPEAPGSARLGLLLLIGPLFAAFLIGRGAVRRFASRPDRLRAAVAASLLAAVLLGLLAVLSAGGVEGGNWPTSGVPAVRFTLVVALELAALSAAVVWVARVPALEGAEPVDERARPDVESDQAFESVEDGESVDGSEPSDGSESGDVGESGDDGGSEGDAGAGAGGGSGRIGEDVKPGTSTEDGGGPKVVAVQNSDGVPTDDRDGEGAADGRIGTSSADGADHKSAAGSEQQSAGENGPDVAHDDEQKTTESLPLRSDREEAEASQQVPKPESAGAANAANAGAENAGAENAANIGAENPASARNASAVPSTPSAGSASGRGGDRAPDGGGADIREAVPVDDPRPATAEADDESATVSPVDSRASGRRRFGDDRGRRRGEGRQTRR